MSEISTASAIGWVMSPIIRKVIGKTLTYLSSNSFKEAGIDEDDMKKMQTTLTEVLSIIGAAEKHRIAYQNQVKLIQQIKDAVYDAEDVMDEFEYNLLKEKFKNQQKTTHNMAASSSRAIHRFMVGNGKFRKKVKEVIESLVQAKVSADTLLHLMNTNCICRVQQQDKENLHITSSLITETKIVGRERECKELIDLLFKEADESPIVIPIVGHGA
ncbi:Disease resistance protein (CC-NBS-LRR class) family [Rhynchospora pubera]|uniref:Disease resistance protein (CC-NBS-LRR class) family n=1 Tax=Rhynchospora pubera TaxID=906938 RepID=A0AAV8GL33_9POAL|nr:Disease resistance protein (CC-NBS-LRR class) family [Rhynchospora pubera]